MTDDKAEEGRDAYMDNIPVSDCPYTDDESAKAWTHGWRRAEEELRSA